MLLKKKRIKIKLLFSNAYLSSHSLCDARWPQKDLVAPKGLVQVFCRLKEYRCVNA